MTNTVKVYYWWYPPIWYAPSSCMTEYTPILMEAKVEVIEGVVTL